MLRVVLVLLMPLYAGVAADITFTFDDASRTWNLSNGIVRASFELNQQDKFRLREITLLGSNDNWQSPADVSSSPIRIQVGDNTLNGDTSFRLLEQRQEDIARGGRRLTLQFADASNLGLTEVDLEMYAGQPVLRYRVRFRPAQTSMIRRAGMLPWSLNGGGGPISTLHLNQWLRPDTTDSFLLNRRTLTTSGQQTLVRSGAYQRHIGYLALRDSGDRGLFAGWEFDGRADIIVQRVNDEGRLNFSGLITGMNRRVEAGQWFHVPGAFLGLFHGDWDDAGWAVQQFGEKILAQPAPEKFPWVVWDSWRYQQNIDEATLRHNAEIAASLGVELFVVDLGWAQAIGDWRADPRKFPSGMKALSDYVHSLGMKFGLHIAFSEAAPESPVLQENPEWASSERYWYFGAESLCLSHRPVREWITSEIIRVIDEYGVDWILQDGENMVKRCTRSGHTHLPQDWNYSNAVDGLNWVVQQVQKARPEVHWENCEDGGNMLTFNMLQNYVTSITSDDSGPLVTRQAVHAMTYVFPMRYTDRYMPNDVLGSYITRSFMFGGPWIVMTRLPEMLPGDLQILRDEIALYKTFRETLRESRVFHLTNRPTEEFIDVIQSYHPPTGTAMLFAYRWESNEARRTVQVRGLDPDRTYDVRFEESGRVLRMSGAQLRTGLTIDVPRYTAEIVWIRPAE
jgi:alpha-galactosidase